MSADTAPAPSAPAPAGPRDRRTALVAGVLYLVTFASSIPALVLQRPILDRPGLVVTAADATRLQVGSLLDLVNAAAAVGTAVALFPVLRRTAEALALGFVAARVLEAATIVVGVVAVLSLASVGHDPGGLVAVHRWAFLLGPGLVPAANALLLGTAVLRARLVPRAIPLVGLVGAPLLLGSAVATVLGALDQVSAAAGLLALPIALWELSLGLYLTAKGFTDHPTP